MNSRGQFSIIAALLVAVVLVGTLVTTYSMIRYSLSQNRSPQILMATDEINSALYKALGFTVGYYGSILQVTGNTTYAKANATNYMNSAIQYIASINPAWATFINLTSLNLRTNWFMNSSYSTGQLSVIYNLAGLGVYGVGYSTSCALSVQIFSSPSNSQVCLNVTQDGTEPEISLAQQNFNFYYYVYSNMTWQLVSPSATPTVFTNGTYIISVPAGIDTSAYVIQVTDPRGITVAASSFNRFNISFAVSPSAQTLFAHRETTNINGAPYYSLGWSSADASSLNLNASMSVARSLLGKFVYSLQGVSSIPASTWTMFYNAWQKPTATVTTNSPSNNAGAWQNGLNAYSSGGGYASSPNRDENHVYGGYGFSIPSGATITQVRVRMDAYCVDNDGITLQVSVDGGITWLLGSTTQYLTTTQTTYWVDVTAWTSWTPSQINSDHIYVRVTHVKSQSTDEVRLDWIPIEVTYATPVTGHVDVDLLIRQSDGSVRTSIANQAAASANLSSAPTTLQGTYSWSAYTVVSQTDYLELDYYVDTTTIGLGTAYLSIDNQTLAFTDQTRTANVTWPLFSLQNTPVIVELLQNGTMRWLGQSLLNTTQMRPIPPIPVKAFHVSLAGTNTDLPFQVEDWASQYRIPLGLTGNFTVFSNVQMIVFPVSAATPQVTIWWNGSDLATQPSSACANNYFTGDNPSGGTGTLTNGNMSLQISYPNSNFVITSITGSVKTFAYFMRVNSDNSTYGSGSPAYVIHHGVVRDVVQEEAEWSSGIPNCPNVYSQIVLTLPANATYYTYQIRLIFLSSAQSRNITDLCPIQLSFSGSGTFQTENGKPTGLPQVYNGTGTFYNSTLNGNWTTHQWSQFISGMQGSGIMLTEAANQVLYFFDNSSQFGTLGQITGALRASGTISVVPVTSRSSVSFTSYQDVTWFGAVATFNSTATPVYATNGILAPNGLWIFAEYLPQVTLTATT